MSYETSNVEITTGFYEGEDHWGDEVNAAMLLFSALVQAGALGRTTQDDLPDSAFYGDVYIITDGDNINKIAIYRQTGGWLYVQPKIGWRVFDRDTSELLIFQAGSGWTVFEGGGGGGGNADYPPFAGHAGDLLAVNATEDGVEWVDPPEGTGGGGGGGSALAVQRYTFAANKVGIGNAWAAVTWDAEPGDWLDDADRSHIVIPAGVTRVRISAYLAYSNVSGVFRGLAFTKNGVDPGNNCLTSFPNYQQYEGNQFGTTGWIDVTPGDYIAVLANPGGGAVVYGTERGTNFGGASFVEIETIEESSGGGGGGGGSNDPTWSAGAFDRRGIITVTATGGSSGVPSRTMGQWVINDFFWQTGNAEKILTFDFHAPNRVTGIQALQDANNGNGTWAIEGSNDNAAWTTLIEDYVMGGQGYGPNDNALPSNVYTREFENPDQYRYYRMRLMPGSSTHNNPYVQQINFKQQPM